MVAGTFLFSVLALVAVCLGDGDNFANQVHLALGEAPGEVVVTWSTPNPPNASSVRYGEAATFPDQSQSAIGWSTRFTDNGTLHHTQYIQRAVLDSLKGNTQYSYQVWNTSEWSRTFSFLSPGLTEAWSPRVILYGDFGLLNPRAFPALLGELADNTSDFIVHTGDFAYDMYRDNATWGDKWFNYVEPLYASLPVMTCVGNHEGIYDYLNYRERFTMPLHEVTENLFFSFNAGNTHWISYSTEFYFVYDAMDDHGGVHRTFGPYPDLAAMQLKFIEEDLIKADAMRSVRPWIFAYGHRPFYCSDSDDDDCIKMRSQWRVDLENLFYKYGVDIIFEAHQHSYERLWPTYNSTVLNSSTPGEPYRNPLAPVHIVTGAAGCEEDLDVFDDGALGPWSAVRITDYGYGVLTIANMTHLRWEQRNVSRQPVDEFWLVRDQHVGYDRVV